MNDKETIHHFCEQIKTSTEDRCRITGDTAPYNISPYHFKKLESTKHIQLKDVYAYMKEIDFLEERQSKDAFNTFLIKF